MAKTQAEVIKAASDAARVALRKLEDASAKRVLLAFRQAQDAIRLKLADGFDAYADGWDLGTMESTGRLTALSAEINRAMGRVYHEVNGTIQQGTVDQFKQAATRTTYMVDQATPPFVQVPLPVMPYEAVLALVETPYKGAMFSQRIGIITNAMAQDIRDGLLQSMINGESMSAAADRVESVIGAGSLGEPGAYSARAEMIARTEMMRASTMGRSSIYEANSDLMAEGGAEWLVAPDDRLCEWCERRDGMSQQEITEAPAGDDPWENDNEPPLHPNCRCTLVPRLKTWKELGVDIPDDMEEDARAIRDEDGKWQFVPQEGYDAWKEARAAV